MTLLVPHHHTATVSPQVPWTEPRTWPGTGLELRTQGLAAEVPHLAGSLLSGREFMILT